MSGEIALIMDRGREWLRRGQSVVDAALEHPACRTVFRQMHRRRRTVAVTGSVALHMLVLLLILPATQTGGFTSGGSVGDGMGAGDGIDLTLYDVAQPAPGSLEVKPADAEDLEELSELDVAEIAEELLLDTEMTSLKLASLSLPDPAVQTDSPSEAEQAASKGATGTGGLTQGSGDDLWAAIAPCWRQMADANTLPVKLEVTFSSGGGLAEPPVIKRAAGMSGNSQVLVSESKAIQALAACGVYPMAAGQQNVAINFPAL